MESWFVWMEFVLGWGFFLVLFSGLDFDDLGFFGNPQFPLFPTVFGFRTSLLSHTFPLCHGVGPNVFGASLPHARHGVWYTCLWLVHGSLPSLATHLPPRLDFTTFLLLFMPSRPFPSKKEMIQSSCTFICISHAFTVGFLYFAYCFSKRLIYYSSYPCPLQICCFVVTLDSPQESFTLLLVWIIFLLSHVLYVYCTWVFQGVFGGLVLQCFNVGCTHPCSYTNIFVHSDFRMSVESSVVSALRCITGTLSYFFGLYIEYTIMPAGTSNWNL